MDVSAFGAVGDEPEGVPFTARKSGSALRDNLGGNAEALRPIQEIVSDEELF
ncbi:MAG: hypothetical protein RR368_02130 [Oscillospiraceae bacterium]